MEGNKPAQKHKTLILTFAILFLTIVNMVQYYKYEKSISRMSGIVNEMNVILIKEQATQLIVLKRIENYYKNSAQGPEALEKFIEMQRNIVYSYLQNESTPEQAKPALENSLKCMPMSCELNTPNKAQPSAASGAP